MSERPLPPAGGSAPGAPIEVDPSALRLVGTLATAGAVAGLAIVLVFRWAEPRILEHRARVLAEAVTEVLGGPERYETLFLEDGVLTGSPRTDTTSLDRVYVGYDAAGRRVGVAASGAAAGFQDVIRVIFGYDPASGEVLGMKVLESKETPGLGDKIEKDSAFVAEFAGVATPLEPVRRGRARDTDAEVITITGATISSRAVVDIINRRLAEVRGPIDAYWAATGAGGGGP